MFNHMTYALTKSCCKMRHIITDAALACIMVVPLLTLTMVVGCMGPKDHQHISESAPSFLSQTLQDSLDLFMATVDSFPNPYGPTIYNILFCKNGNDTLVCFCAYGYLIEPRRFDRQGLWDDIYQGEGIGARTIENKVLTIGSAGIDNLDSIVNMEVFSKEIYDDYLAIARKLHKKVPWDGWEPVPSERYYKLVGKDSISFLKARYSKYERNIKD